VLRISAGRYDAERIDLDFATPGKYFVHVHSEGGDGGDYQIWGISTDAGEDMWFDAEPNDSAALAGTAATTVPTRLYWAGSRAARPGTITDSQSLICSHGA
jgi:hypothetical protein